MKTHDFYLFCDTEKEMKSSELHDLEICELIIHDGLLRKQYRDVIQEEENERVRQAGGKRREMTEKDAKNEAKRRAMDVKNGMVQHPDLAVPHRLMPPTRYSISLRLEWVLKTPFFSRSTEEFGAIDNPLTKDTLTNYPVLHGSGAKGMLRHTAVANQVTEREVLTLFGNTTDIQDADAAIAGMVVTGDVIFESKSKLEVFSPHERDTRTAKLPVYFEVVPAGAKASWELLLFDFRDEKQRTASYAATVLRNACDLITVLGMSAKSSSGFGIGKELKVSMQSGGAVALPAQAMEIKQAIEILEKLK